MTDTGPAPSRRRRPRPRPLTTADPVEIALEQLSPQPAGETLAQDFLRSQKTLVESQIRLAANEAFRNRIKAVRDVAFTLGAVAIIGLAGWMVWDAARADEVILEPWTAPPAFAAAGQGGEVLAAQLGDRLRVLQTKGEIEATGVAKAAGGQSTELKLEIPSTGVSIGELQSWLRRTLGHQTIVGGSVVQLADGRLSITVRPGDSEAATFEGPPAELPALLDKAAEATLRRSDPLRYAGFLIFAGRLDEAAAVVEPLTRRGSPRERANAMANMVNIRNYQGRLREALDFARRSVALDPNAAAAVGYLAGAEYVLGHEEEALAAAHRMVKLTRDRGAQDEVAQYTVEEDVHLWPTMVAEQQGDTQAAIAGYAGLADLAQAWNNPARARTWDYQRSLAFLQAHDVAAARAAAPRPQAATPGDLRALSEALLDLRIAAVAALELGRLPEARALALEAVALQRRDGAALAVPFQHGDAPRLADILIRTGDLQAAHALLDASPMDCTPCVRARANLASAERDWPRADRFYALATRLAPSVRAGWSAWGQSMAARGAPAAAIPLYRRAQQAGPRWASPLKYEGDALMAQGKAAAAAKRYAIAAERAPKWGALQLAWGDALSKAGRKDQAVARWKAALGCELSAGDRAVVKGRLANNT